MIKKMSTVVYLANKRVQVVVGVPGAKKITVSGSYMAECPEGSIINGMIMDVELFAGFMRDFWKSSNLPTKDVILVVNSSKFVGKTIELPIMNDKKTREYVEREFADVRRDEEFLYSYIPISQNGKMRKLYVEGITPDFIKDYIDIFAEFGVKLSAVYSAESSLIGLTKMTIGRTYKTFVLQIAGPMTITTLLWVDGAFYYFNSTRCFHEQGTADYANDIAMSVSQITQFMQANQIEHRLETVFLAGVESSLFPMYREAIIQQGIQIPIEIFSDSGIVSLVNLDVQKILPAASGLVENGKWENFLEGYKAGRKKKEEGNGEFVKTAILIGSIFAVMVIGTAVTFTMKQAKKKKLTEIKDYNESPAVMMDVAMYDALLERNSFLAGQYNAIASIEENIATYPVCDKETMKVVQDCAASYASVQFDSFDADAGVMMITATSATVDEINLFIRNLTQQEIFSNIDYTGYSYQETSQLWDIHVTCTMAEAAGR